MERTLESLRLTVLIPKDLIDYINFSDFNALNSLLKAVFILMKGVAMAILMKFAPSTPKLLPIAIQSFALFSIIFFRVFSSIPNLEQSIQTRYVPLGSTNFNLGILAFKKLRM